jgi:hypothetical protein
MAASNLRMAAHSSCVKCSRNRISSRSSSYRRLRQLAGRGTLLRAESGDLSTVNTVGFGPRQFLPGKPVRTQRID